MAFVTPLLLAGALLVAVPIVLHLRRRQEPRRVVFPALRLLRQNRQRNETRLRVRRLLLLALRCGLLAALAAALARPLWLPPGAAGDGPSGETAALALVVDNGPNTRYRVAGETCLDAAIDTAEWLLDRLPDGAPVVLADRSPGGRATRGDAASAALRLERLRTTDATRPLVDAIADAARALAETPASRREVYALTDLSAGAWDGAAADRLVAALSTEAGVSLRLIDVGARGVRNAAIGTLTTNGPTITEGEPLEVTAPLIVTGEAEGARTVQLLLDTPEGPVKRDERVAEVGGAAGGGDGLGSGDATVAFRVAGLEPGYHTGTVRVLGGDAAPDDDARRFAVEVRPPRSVLIAAPTEPQAVFLRAAIDPQNAVAGATRRFTTEVVTHDKLAAKPLDGVDAVMLVDPSPAIGRRRGWRRLYDHAVAGGGVALFLGREATRDAFNIPAAQTLLPGELDFRSRAATHLRPDAYDHPMLRPLAPYAESIPWPAFPVWQRWELAALDEGANPLVAYADGGPAIVEQPIGRGRVVTMTTTVGDQRSRRDAWNLLPTGDEPWPFVLLARSLTGCLVGAEAERLEFLAGETVSVPLPAGLETPGVVVRTPSGEALRQPAPPGQPTLSVAGATAPGAYRVEAGGAAALLDRAFVVNLHPEDGRLARVDVDTLVEDLRARLGDDRVALVRGRDQLGRVVQAGRLGRELTPWVLLLAAVALAGEQAVANRFYRESGDGES
ncbi:MAG: BatA domain-containing protein [Planctomycetota bacterium]